MWRLGFGCTCVCSRWSCACVGCRLCKCLCVVCVEAAFRGGVSPASIDGILLHGGVCLSSSRMWLEGVARSRSALVGGGRLAEAGIGGAGVMQSPTDAVRNAQL